ncbi:hypothetical protein ID866_11889 [Astraeus odoratus]|nr:hypothetical protein ID866_11889 [Astraeus odoratus]
MSSLDPRFALERFKDIERSSRYSINLTEQVDILDGFIIRGGYGTVYQGVLRDHGVEVAIKVPPGCIFKEDTIIQHFLQEVHIWSKFSHKNVLPYFGITTKLNLTVSLVSQWMYKGNAHEYVQDVTVDPRPLVS